MDNNQKSLLQLIRPVINENIGKTITRRQLRDVMGDRTESYLDTTRRKLTVCGYLSDTVFSGRYQVVKKIPDDLTINGLTKLYNVYNQSGMNSTYLGT
jgi:hypothetical protein